MILQINACIDLKQKKTQKTSQKSKGLKKNHNLLPKTSTGSYIWWFICFVLPSAHLHLSLKYSDEPLAEATLNVPC